MNTAADSVMSLLSSLGFDTDSPAEIKIDTFDQWSNSDAAAVFGSCTACSALIAQ
jgi:hypothetical protein